MEIGKRIKAARIAKGLTQEELGELLGVQKSAVAKYESGRVVNIKRSVLQKISEVLNIAPSDLVSDEIKKKNDAQTDIVVRLRTDSEFLSVVELLHRLNAEQLASIKQTAQLLLK